MKLQAPTHCWRAAGLGAAATLICLGLAGATGHGDPLHLLTSATIDSGQSGPQVERASTSTSTTTSTSKSSSAATTTATTAVTTTSSVAAATASGSAGEEQGQQDQKEAGDQNDQAGDKQDGPQDGHNDTGANADHQFDGQE